MFEDVQGYDDIVMLMNIDVEFYCEYYIVLILGVVYVVYLLIKVVVGIFKIVCVVEIFFKCLQMQEIMMVQIVDVLMEVMELFGVVVYVDVKYQCMIMCGVYYFNVFMIMMIFIGEFKIDVDLCNCFLCLVEKVQWFWFCIKKRVVLLSCFFFVLDQCCDYFRFNVVCVLISVVVSVFLLFLIFG